MLPRASRLRRSSDFAEAIRRGRRSGGRTIVVHAWAGPLAGSPRVGLVVGRRVGHAVDRNQVKRRLRHLMVARLRGLPAGQVVVIRALPPASTASSAELGADLDRCLQAIARRRAAT